jgi:hypothetical protein
MRHTAFSFNVPSDRASGTITVKRGSTHRCWTITSAVEAREVFVPGEHLAAYTAASPTENT